MKVILRQDVDKLGKMGDTVTVKDGYARNYLLPREYAYIATPGAIKRLEAERRQYEKRMEKAKASAEELAAKLADLQISLSMKVGEEGKLYGSVSTQMIAAELTARGFDIDKRNIIIEEPIKSLGIFDIKVKLHTEVLATLKVWVISEE